MNWSELNLLMPVGVVLGSALIVVFLDLVLDRKDRYILPWLALTGCLLGLISVVQTCSVLDRAPWFHTGAPPGKNVLDALILKGAFALDRFGLYIWIISCAAGALAILASPGPSEDSALSSGEYYGLILLAVAGMMLLAVSHDWLTLLINLEIMSIATYILTGSHRENTQSNEAALKYLVLGAFSTAFLLMGIAFYYGAYGSISLSPGKLAEGRAPAAASQPSEKPAKPDITSAPVARGAKGQDFKHTLTAEGSVPLKFSAGPLPAGLSLKDATIFGTPAELGRTEVTVTASNKLGSATQVLVITVHPPGSRLALVWLSLGLILVGALFKVGAAPFHFWIPDVYQGAPTGITGLMAVGVKAAGFAVVARLVFETFGERDFRGALVPLLSVAAMLTMIVGNILAMRQGNIKRLLAYSGIAHTGYLLLGFLIMPNSSDATAIDSHLKAVVFYLMVYGVMTLGAFGVISLLREDGKPMEEMDDYKGLAKEHPGIAACMALFMLSLAGMPPMGGFFAKFLLFRGAIDEGHILPAVVGILTSVASLYYYLRVIVVMYMSPANETSGAQSAQAVRCQYAWGPHLLIVLAGIVTMIIGIFPGWFY